MLAVRLMTGSSKNHEPIDEATRLQAELTGQLCAPIIPGMYGAVVAAVFLLICLWSVVPHGRLVVWLVVFTALQVGRHLLVRSFNRVSPSGSDLLPWGSRFAAGAGATALMWGLTGVVFFPSQSVPHQFFLALFLGGVAGSTTVAQSPSPQSYIPSIVLPLLPCSARFLYEGDQLHVIGGVAVLVFCAVLLLTGRRIHALMAESVRLRLEKSDLAASLEVRKTRSDELAEDLKREMDELRRKRDALERAQQDLESSVAQRTSELLAINEELRQEIEERKKTEKELERSEDRYRRLVDNAGYLVYATDAQGVLTIVSPTIVRLTGYSYGEFVGRHYLEFVPSEYRDRVARFYGRQFVKKLPDTYYECPVVTKQGHVVWLGQHTQLILEGEEVAGFQSIARDITDRKKSEEALRQSEEKYRTIIENVEEGYYEVDIAGNIVFCNDSLCRIIGYPRNELIGMNNRQFMDKKTAKDTYKTFNQVYTTGKPTTTLGWELVRKDGSRVSIEASVSLIRDSRGKAVGFRGVCRDVTERKQSEELAGRWERLQAVGQLATGVAHNFNNLLQIVINAAEIAIRQLRQGESGQVERNLERILESSRFGAETVKRLQDFGLVRSRNAADEEAVFDLSRMVEQAVDMSQPWWKTQPEKEGITIELHCDLEQGCLVKGKEHEVFGVALNLIKNAAEAMPLGGELEILTYSQGDNVFLRVKDEGVGIEKEDFGKVFEPFWTTKGYRGVGMGLAASFGVVRRHGGEILLESEKGIGTTVTVRLPLSPRAPAQDKPKPKDNPSGRYSVLAIDDNVPFLTTLGEGLRALGHTAFAADSGRQGLELYSRNHIDVVVCDLGMPEMNGWEVASAIRSDCLRTGRPKTPFILLTGWGGQLDEQRKIAQCGVDCVVEKPVDLHDLLTTIRSLLADSNASSHEGTTSG